MTNGRCDAFRVENNEKQKKHGTQTRQRFYENDMTQKPNRTAFLTFRFGFCCSFYWHEARTKFSSFRAAFGETMRFQIQLALIKSVCWLNANWSVLVSSSGFFYARPISRNTEISFLSDNRTVRIAAVAAAAIHMGTCTRSNCHQALMRWWSLPSSSSFRHIG